MRRRPPSRPSREIEVAIDRLGTEGAGLARVDGRLVAIPGALPGERVRARLSGDRATLLEVLDPCADRIAPACRHFGTCGGCALQNLAGDPYRAFKRAQVADALARQGFDPGLVAEVVTSPPGTRRRASLSAKRADGRVVLGFHGRESDAIIDIAACPVLVPELEAFLDPLRALHGRVSFSGAILTATETGIDLLLDLPNEPGLRALEALAAFADTRDLARLSWRVGTAEPIPTAARRAPILRFGDVPVALPPGAFLQATAAGEAALVTEMLAWLDGAKSVLDLYAGCGTFALALGAKRDVHAVEADPFAINALAAAGRAAGRNRLTTERRDLEARPLQGADLAKRDGVVLDPPRAGAKAQCAALAASTIPRLVYVSCDPATFARDAATLRAGGYRLERVVPVDQFLWSSHVELVARFSR
jgi:23S rRNA (uracil1939-C5)-methyltransferase